MCSASNDIERIKSYFQTISDRFDKIYSDDKSTLQLLRDRLFRRSMHKRFELTLKECQGIADNTVLDVGCGSGRYSVALARLGAGRVAGIDFSENMLRKARALADENGVLSKCDFIYGDFLTYNFNQRYDIGIAIGLFDYIKKPEIFLKRLADLVTKKIIISFPVKYSPETILRKIRLCITGCPVYFYTAKKIKMLLSGTGLDDYRIVNLGRDYLVVIDI